MIKFRHPRPKEVLYSLFFESHIYCWRNVGVIVDMVRERRPELGLFWAIVETLAGWEHLPKPKRRTA